MFFTHLAENSEELANETATALCGARVARSQLVSEPVRASCLMCYELNWRKLLTAAEIQQDSHEAAAHPR